MSFYKTLLLGLTVFTVGIWATGCSSKTKTDATKSGSNKSAGKTNGQDHSNDKHGEHSDDDHEKIQANLAKLSDEDRVLAEKQKMCPVSEEALGSMGKPIKLDINGKSIFICCKGCEEQIREDPEKYFAIIKKHDH